MTTWNLDVTETEPGTGLHTTGSAPVTTTLARLGTNNPQVMAATLRALADRLDPPKPPRVAYRASDRTAARIITPDGCGPEHTYREGCTYTDAPRAR